MVDGVINTQMQNLAIKDQNDELTEEQKEFIEQAKQF